jgi:LPS-assembly lipoprotein
MLTACRNLLCLLCITVLISACGFHLRGNVELPESWKTVRLITANPNGDLGRELATTLEVMGIELNDSADIILKLGNEQFRRRSVSVGTGARANRYELELTTQVSISDRSGTVLMKSSELNVLKLMNHDPNNVVGEEEEIRLLRSEMRTELVQRILRGLRSQAAQ